MFCIKKLGFSWIGLLALLVLPAAAIDKPLGYERFTPLTVDSDTFTEKTPKYVFEHYAQPLTLGVVQKGLVTDKRLIDIETHRDKSGNLTLSGVWIENKGDFEQESWLLLDLTYGDLIEFHELLEEEFIPIDVERYDDKHGNLRYALILQRNIHKAEWLLKPDVTAEQIRYDEEEFRLVDFDIYNKDQEKYVYSPRYDAIMVRNTGPNYAEWHWSSLPTDHGVTEYSPDFFAYHIYEFKLFGLQATDIEWAGVDQWVPNGTVGGAALFVYSARDFRVGSCLQADWLSPAQAYHGPVIDLEGGPEGMEDYSSNWHPWESCWFAIFCY